MGYNGQPEAGIHVDPCRSDSEEENGEEEEEMDAD